MRHTSFNEHCWRLVALVAMLSATTAVRAQAPEVTYDLDFSTDLNLLLDPNDPVAQMFATWKTPTQLAALRSAPMIRLTNRADSDLSITQLRLDMGDPNVLFDSFAFLEQPDNGAPVVTSHTDLTFLGDMRTFLVIQFPVGLAPGDSFSFQVRLANIGGAGLANYEDVLWDKNDALVPNRLDNALVTVTAGSLSVANPIVLNFPPVRLFEYPLANATFPQDNLGASGSSTLLPDSAKMSMVAFERFTQGAVIPEPGTAALCCAGLVGMFVVRRRRRKG